MIKEFPRSFKQAWFVGYATALGCIANLLLDLADHIKTEHDAEAVLSLQTPLNITCAGRPHLLAALDTQSCARESQLINQ